MAKNNKKAEFNILLCMNLSIKKILIINPRTFTFLFKT